MKLVLKYFKSNPNALSCSVYVGREKNDYSDSWDMLKVPEQKNGLCTEKSFWINLQKTFRWTYLHYTQKIDNRAFKV